MTHIKISNGKQGEANCQPFYGSRSPSADRYDVKPRINTAERVEYNQLLSRSKINEPEETQDMEVTMKVHRFHILNTSRDDNSNPKRNLQNIFEKELQKDIKLEHKLTERLKNDERRHRGELPGRRQDHSPLRSRGRPNPEHMSRNQPSVLSTRSQKLTERRHE